MIEKLLNSLSKRWDYACYALACDDEANQHYCTSPSTYYRLKIAIVAFICHR